MARYLLLWEIDRDKVPVDRKERAALWGPMIETVKQEMKEGTCLDWGAYAGGMKGYSIEEGDEMTISNTAQSYIPYVTFEVHPILSVDQMAQLVDNLNK